MSASDEPDPRDVALLAGPLAEVFEEEADAQGLARLLRAAASGQRDGLSPDELLMLDDFLAEQARWQRDGLAVDVPSPGPRRAAPATPVERRPPAVARPRRWWAPALALAAAALVAVVWWSRSDEQTAPALLMKGAFDLHVTVVRPGGLAEVQPGERLATGDALGLAYTVPVPGHLRVLAAGDDGVAQLHPGPDGDTAVPAAVEAPLPAGATLAAVDGPTCEYVVGLFAEAPIPAEAAAAAVRAALAEADGGRCRLGPIALPGVFVDAVGIRR